MHNLSHNTRPDQLFRSSVHLAWFQPKLRLLRLRPIRVVWSNGHRSFVKYDHPNSADKQTDNHFTLFLLTYCTCYDGNISLLSLSHKDTPSKARFIARYTNKALLVCRLSSHSDSGSIAIVLNLFSIMRERCKIYRRQTIVTHCWV